MNPRGPKGVPSDFTAQTEERADEQNTCLMEQVVSRRNMQRALKRVKQNRGAAGVDGMAIESLEPYLQENWPTIKQELLEGSHNPSPVRRVQIPKPNGGKRDLGIPTVLDRLIQQALLQILTPIFDPGFSRHSYGFRPGRKAHQAVKEAQGYMQEGYRYVVDMDLEDFFNRVNHDILMNRVARKVQDKRVLRLIRGYLSSGVMLKGCCVRSEEGTPQGGPLSPLLANILLDDLDKELEKRGHRFVRYADDCNIYVSSWRAANRVLEGITRFVEDRLKLKVNRQKSAAARPWKRKLLGFSFTQQKATRIRLAPKTIERFKDKIRDLTRRSWGISMKDRLDKVNEYLLGWIGYFWLTEAPSILEALDEWIRRRLRMCRLKQWKKSKTKRKRLVALGIPEDWAGRISGSRKGYWRLTNTPQVNKALGLAYWQDQGLLSLMKRYSELRYSL